MESVYGRRNGPVRANWHRPNTVAAIDALVVLLILTGVGCQRDEAAFPNRPLTIVCPWSQGGGTDRVSRAIAVHLEHELDEAVNVVNATGGKGVTGHSRGLLAKPDGHTLTMMTLELNTMHWSGLTSLTIDDAIPLMSLNEDYAALFVRADSEWQTLNDAAAAVKANPGELKASGTATGGAWHLAIAGWLIAIGQQPQDITWVASAGSAPSLQELISDDRNMHFVCCALNEADSLLQSGQVRALGVMSPKRAVGYEEVPTFQEQGVDWSLGGWRAVGVPKGTPTDITDRLTIILERIVSGKTKVAGETFPEFMRSQKFDYTHRSGQELHSFLHANNDKLGQLLSSESMQAINRDAFDAMTFPYTIFALLAIVGCGLGWQSWQHAAHLAGEHRADDRHKQSDSVPHSASAHRRGRIAFVLVIASLVFYFLAVESLGFLLTAGLIVVGLNYALGGRHREALLLAFVFCPVVYALFTAVLRVPLPKGLLGW